LLHLLRELGGVIIESPYIFTETLDWLEDIKNLKVVNKGNPYVVPKVFAFFFPQDGSISKR